MPLPGTLPRVAARVSPRSLLSSTIPQFNTIYHSVQSTSARMLGANMSICPLLLQYRLQYDNCLVYCELIGIHRVIHGSTSANCRVRQYSRISTRYPGIAADRAGAREQIPHAGSGSQRIGCSRAMKIRKAVVPAAGLGTRVLPATKAIPKEMLPLADKPTIQYVIEEAVASGITHVIIVTSRTKRSIEDHFDETPELRAALERKGDQKKLEMLEHIENMVQLSFTRQPAPRGLGHAILMARDLVGDEPFGVLLGDDLVVNDREPCLRQLMDVHER